MASNLTYSLRSDLQKRLRHLLNDIDAASPRRWLLGLLLFSLSLYFLHVAIAGSVRWGDSFFYYAYTRSIVHDRDINLVNESRYPGNEFPAPTIINQKTGLYQGVFVSPGVGFFWLIPYFPAEVAVAGLRLVGLPLNPDGFSKLSMLVVGTFCVFLSISGLALLEKVLRELHQPHPRWSILTLLLTTQLFFYTALDPLNTHSVTFFFSCLLMWLFGRWWLLSTDAAIFKPESSPEFHISEKETSTRPARTPHLADASRTQSALEVTQSTKQTSVTRPMKQTSVARPMKQASVNQQFSDIAHFFSSHTKLWWISVFMGLALGLLGFMRNQDWLAGVGVAIGLFTQQTAMAKKTLSLFSMGAVASIFVGLQLLFNWYVNGTMNSPYTASGAFAWTHPDVLRVLFSPGNGQLFYAPVVMIMLCGTCWLIWHGVGLMRAVALAGLIYFCLELYVIAAWSPEILGGPYGSRMFTATLPWLVLGLSVSLHWLWRKQRGIWIWLSLLGLAFGWNCLQILSILLRNT